MAFQTCKSKDVRRTIAGLINDEYIGNKCSHEYTRIALMVSRPCIYAVMFLLGAEMDLRSDS